MRALHKAREFALRRTVLLMLLAATAAAGLLPTLEVSALGLTVSGGGTAALGAAAPTAGQVILLGTESDAAAFTFESRRKAAVTDAAGEEHFATAKRGEHVHELLERMGIVLGPMELALADVSDETVRVRVGTDFVYYETAQVQVEPGTVTTEDYTLEKGERIVTREGSAGTSRMTYEVVWADGRMLSRQAVAEEVIVPRTDTYVTVGTLVREAQRGDTIREVVTLDDGSGYLLLQSGESLHFTGTMAVKCTAYTTGHDGVGTITYTGTTVRVGCVAVDKKVIPLGTNMFIASDDGYLTYGMARAEDTGVKGAKVDLYMESYDECMAFGIRRSTVYFLDGAEADGET